MPWDGVVEWIGRTVDGATDAIWGFVQDAAVGLMSIVTAMIGVLPDAVDLNLPDLSGWVRGYDMMDRVVPVTEALVAWGIYMAAANAQFLWNLGTRLYHLIPKPGMGT